MQKLLFTCLLACVGVASYAQQHDGPPSLEERLKKTKEVLQKELQLNASQLAAVETNFKHFFAQADKVRKENPPPPPNAKVMQQMQALEKNRDEKIASVLNADQVKKYKELVEKMRPPKRGEGRPDGPPPPKQ